MTADPTALDTARLREKAEKATPGPWQPWCAWETGVKFAAGTGVLPDGLILAPTTFAREHRQEFQANAAYIAAVDPTTLLALIDAHDAAVREVEELRAVVARVRDLHRRSVAGTPYGEYVDRAACRHCRRAWPCDTFRALGGDL